MQYVQDISYTFNSSQWGLAFNKNAVSIKIEHCILDRSLLLKTYRLAG